MKREDLYKAIGGISSRYIIDVPGKRYSDTVSSHHSPDERVIEVKTVKRKKKVLLIAAVILLIAGMTAAVAFGLLKKKDKNDRITQKKIENYFTDSGKYDLQINSNIEDLAAGKERVFFSSYISDGQPLKKLALTDINNNKTKEIDISGLDPEHFQKIYMSESCSFICYEDKNGNNRICRFDSEFSSETAVIVKTEGYVTEISETKRNTVLFTECVNGDDNAELKVFEYSMDLLEPVNAYSFENVVSEGKYSDIKNIITDEEYFYIICEKKNGQNDLIKKDMTGATVYVTENICGDADGKYSGCIMSSNGDIVVFTSFINSEGKLCHSFDQISSETGEVIYRYDEVLNVSGFPPCYLIQVYTDDTDQDFEYIDYESGTVYGYSFDSEEQTELWKIDDPSLKNLSDAACSNDHILYGYEDSSETEKGPAVFVTDLNGNIIRKILLKQDRSYENSSVNALKYVNDNDELYLLKRDTYNKEGSMDLIVKNTLCHYSRDGEMIESFPLSIPTAYDLSDMDTENRFYYDFIVRDDGTIVCVSIGTVSFFSSDGDFIAEKEFEGFTGRIASSGNEDYMITDSQGFYKTDGKIYRISKDGCSLEFVSDFGYLLGDGIFDGDDKYDFYFSESDGIYGYSIAEKEIKEIINWIDSDLDAVPATVEMIDSDRILCGINDYFLSFDPLNSDYKISTFMLERASDEVLKNIRNRKTLTIACDSINEALMKKISEFNRTHQDCRITVREYGRYAEEISGLNQFNRDLISGIVPDIVINSGEIDMAGYSELGMFADLNEFIDGENGIDRSEYFDNVFRTFSRSGKQYELPLFFRINEIVGRQSDVGDISSITFEELERMSEEKRLFSGNAEELVNDLIEKNLTEFVNIENFTCDFDNEDFIRLLKIIKREASEDSGYYNDFINRKCALYCTEINRNMTENLKYDLQVPYSLIGYPSSGTDGTLLSTYFSAAIAEVSDNKEYAWEFIKILLSDDIQNLPYNHSVFINDNPVKRSAAEKICKDNDQIYSLIENASRAVINESSISRIINEQINIYLGSGQSAEDTARIIQKKASLYLKEIK